MAVRKGRAQSGGMRLGAQAERMRCCEAQAKTALWWH